MERPPLQQRILSHVNRLVAPLVRRGLRMGPSRAPMALLTIRGRNSGLPRSVLLALEPVDHGWIVISVYGPSDWSRNLEAAGTATVTMRGSTTPVDAERLSPTTAAPILREAMAEAPWVIRWMTSRYYTTTGSSMEDWEREAETHPVFRLMPATVPSSTASSDSQRAEDLAAYRRTGVQGRDHVRQQGATGSELGGGRQ